MGYSSDDDSSDEELLAFTPFTSQKSHPSPAPKPLPPTLSSTTSLNAPLTPSTIASLHRAVSYCTLPPTTSSSDLNWANWAGTYIPVRVCGSEEGEGLHLSQGGDAFDEEKKFLLQVRRRGEEGGER